MPSATTGPSVPDELITSFRRDGFVVVPAVLAPSDLAAYAPAVTRAVTATWAANPEAHDLWSHCAEVAALASLPALASAAAALLGADRLRLWGDHACFDEPGGGTVPAHRDHDDWPIAEARTLTAWIPLDGGDGIGGDGRSDGDGDGGGTTWRGYVVGSHRAGLRRLLAANGRGDPDGADDVLGTAEDDGLDDDARDAVFVTVPPGAVAFHHGLTVHRTRPNDGPRVRRSLAISYVADGCTWAPVRSRVTSMPGRPDLVPGAPIDGPRTPLVWPAS